MGILEDFRYAWRALRAHAGFAATIAAILGLAIGANSAVFALVNAVILAPLPFPDPERLVAITQTRPDSMTEPFSIPDYRDLRDGNRTFETLAAMFQWSANLTGGDAERVQGMRASSAFFSMLGIRADLGRTLTPADEQGSGARVVVLTKRFWLRRFGGSPAAIGSPLILNGDRYTIVGVLPATLITPVRDAELIAPFPIDTDPRRSARDSGFLRVLGRMRPGVTAAEARVDLDAIMSRLRVEYPTTNVTHAGTDVTGWREALTATQRPVLVLLQGAVALVLLVACANVGNLFLASAIRREPEFAVRAALGASAGRRARQIFVETLLISLTAGLAGIALQTLLVRLLTVLAPADLLALAPPQVANRRVLVFTVLVVVGATLLFGAMAAWRLARPLAITRARGASASHRRVRGALVTAEVAIAAMLITVAIALSQSFARLQAVDPGFSADRLLTARLTLPRGRYAHTEQIQQFTDALLPKLRAIPGVVDAAAVNVVPLNGYHATADVWPADRPLPPPEERLQAEYRMISPSYVRTFGVPLIAGRSFDEHDAAFGEPVILISRTLARRYWTVETAVGHGLAIDDSPDGPRRARIVGVVGDVKHYGLERDVTPDVYTPIPQVPNQTSQWLANNMYWGLRTSVDANSVREGFRRALRDVDPDVPASAVKTMDEAIDVALLPRRTNLWLVRAFGAVALLLAAAGVYAVTSFTVVFRRRELAIRSALGASADANLRRIVADAARPIVYGLVIGGAGASVAAPALRSVLFRVDPLAPAPLAIVTVTLLVAGLSAATVAALPIRKIDPFEALRVE
jgi:predicted permease